MDKEKELIDYPTIKAAVAGEAWAIEKVVAHYADYIEETCTVEVKGPDGSVKRGRGHEADCPAALDRGNSKLSVGRS